MTHLITGVAGLVGCRLARVLLERGEEVTGLDDLSRGSLRNLEPVAQHRHFTFTAVDLADLAAYRKTLGALHERRPIAQIWHLAANSDIAAGMADPSLDFRDTFLTTFHSLILARELEIGSIAFASTSAVYGDLGGRPLSENTGPLFPVSNYGAMKLASEAAISAALESHLSRAFLFRFPNVVGIPATHGVIHDFLRKLKSTPGSLEVLGDGTQQKSYLHVDDLIDAMLFIVTHAHDRLNYFNIGPADAGVTVKFIAETVVARAAPGAAIRYGRGNKGWPGDVPRFSYSIDKLSALGWRARLDSALAVRKAVDEMARQEYGA